MDGLVLDRAGAGLRASVPRRRTGLPPRAPGGRRRPASPGSSPSRGCPALADHRRSRPTHADLPTLPVFWWSRAEVADTERPFEPISPRCSETRANARRHAPSPHVALVRAANAKTSMAAIPCDVARSCSRQEARRRHTPPAQRSRCCPRRRGRMGPARTSARGPRPAGWRGKVGRSQGWSVIIATRSGLAGLPLGRPRAPRRVGQHASIGEGAAPDDTRGRFWGTRVSGMRRGRGYWRDGGTRAPAVDGVDTPEMSAVAMASTDSVSTISVKASPVPLGEFTRPACHTPGVCHGPVVEVIGASTQKAGGRSVICSVSIARIEAESRPLSLVPRVTATASTPRRSRSTVGNDQNKPQSLARAGRGFWECALTGVPRAHPEASCEVVP